MNSKLLFAVLAAAMLLASGCVSIIKTPGQNASDDNIATELDDVDQLIAEMGINSQDEGAVPTKTVMEGETVSFPNLKAVDPDGDPITYSFSEPLDEEGEWQTAKGDAGNYKITITASDGVNLVSQDVLVVVKALNKAPVMQELDDLEINEGDTVQLNPVVSDADGDKVEVTFSGWMDSAKKKTGYDDSGKHEVVVTASDGKDSVSQAINVLVANVNQAPKLEQLEDIKVDEGKKVVVEPEVSDADGDDVTVTFSEPLSSNGEWQTARGDAGKYLVRVTATDGALNAEDSFYITVQSTNAVPVFEGVADIEVTEGDLVELNIKASDPEGKDVTLAYGEPFDENGAWQTTFSDEGVYTVVVTASDGAVESEAEFKVTVNDINRPPVFLEGSFE